MLYLGCGGRPQQNHTAASAYLVTIGPTTEDHRAERLPNRSPKRTLVERVGMFAMCQKRTKCIAAKHRQFINSSAVTKRDCGTVMPSPFAALVLMTSLNFVGWTRRSAGLAPLKMRST